MGGAVMDKRIVVAFALSGNLNNTSFGHAFTNSYSCPSEVDGYNKQAKVVTPRIRYIILFLIALPLLSFLSLKKQTAPYVNHAIVPPETLHTALL
jgi:hypothetical protein